MLTIEHLIAVPERSKMSVLDKRMDAALREYSPVQLQRVCLQHARCLRPPRMEVEAGLSLQRLLLTAQRAKPVGLDDVIEGFCPPDYKNMSEAADALLEEKCGKGDTYGDPADFERAYETLDIAQRFLNEVPRYRTSAWPSARPPVLHLKGNY